jgi:hypothetical protein
MNGLTVILSLLSAIAGASLNMLFNRLLARRQNKIQNTWRVYHDFQSKEMLDSRHRASETLRANVAKQNPLSLNELKASNYEEFYHISRVVHFIEMMVTLSKHNQVDTKLLKNLLGDVLQPWYDEKLLAHYAIERRSASPWSPLVSAVDGLAQQKLVAPKTQEELAAVIRQGEEQTL